MNARKTTKVGFVMALFGVCLFAMGCQQPSTGVSKVTSGVTSPDTQASVPVVIGLQHNGGPVQVGSTFDIELYLSSAEDKGVAGVQACLAWDPDLFYITGVDVYAPMFFGGFPQIYAYPGTPNANEDLADGEAVFVYAADFPPAVLPRTNVHLATIHCRALASGEAILDVVHQVPSSTLWSRVATIEAGELDDAPVTLTSCYVEIVALIGDVNSDGIVDNSDLIAVRVHRGQPVTDETIRYDVNRDGVIDNADMIAVRVKRGS